MQIGFCEALRLQIVGGTPTKSMVLNLNIMKKSSENVLWGCYPKAISDDLQPCPTSSGSKYRLGGRFCKVILKVLIT